MGSQTILIIEDDESIAAGLALNLKLAGYTTIVVQDGHSALQRLASDLPDLILLDINLPKKNGLEVLSELRHSGNSTPVIMLSAREDEYDKVAALRLGADDYVTKPFGLAELMARLDAVLRRTHSGASTRVRSFGDVFVDLDTRNITRAGQPVKLTPLEFELLCFLMSHPERVFSRQKLLREVWKQGAGTPRTVDNFVAQLRSKLEADADEPRHFITVRGSGYRFDP